jgi:hypothetical protein
VGRVDGKEFFRQARSRLPPEGFSRFLQVSASLVNVERVDLVARAGGGKTCVLRRSQLQSRHRPVRSSREHEALAQAPSCAMQPPPPLELAEH